MKIDATIAQIYPIFCEDIIFLYFRTLLTVMINLFLVLLFLSILYALKVKNKKGHEARYRKRKIIGPNTFFILGLPYIFIFSLVDEYFFEGISSITQICCINLSFVIFGTFLSFSISHLIFLIRRSVIKYY